MSINDEEEFDEFETITMTDDESGEETEFAIIDNLQDNGERYLLAVESAFADEDEADAVILKEISFEGDDVTYSVVDTGEEFDRVSELFFKASEEYDIEIN